MRVYRCPNCETEYTSFVAAARRYLCCGVELEHVTQAKDKSEGKGVSTVQHTPSNLVVVEVIPPRENSVDALAVETLLGSLGIESTFSLEIAGDVRGRRFLVRAPSEYIVHLKAQLQAVYDQIAFREVQPEQDPANISDASTLTTAQLILRRPVYLPLRTYHEGDFREADPIRGLLGAFGEFAEDERALAQLVLRPAPADWADAYQGSARQIEQTFAGQAASPLDQLRMMGLMILLALGLAVCLQLFFVSRQGLSLALIGWSFCGGAFLALIAVLFWLLLHPARPDPKLVQQKISLPAYDVALHLTAGANSTERAQARLKQLASAYRQFNLSSGNAFVLKENTFDPRDLSQGFPNWWRALLGYVMRLNTAELASLWHLPFGEGAPLVERTLTKRLLPMRDQVAQGVLVGHAVHQGERIPVHLSDDSFNRHMLLVAKTQKGKSTLMAHLATAAMKDSNRALAVIDPHGDLARSLLGLVPEDRIGDVIYIDFSDPNLVVGLNLLDTSQGRSPDKIVSNIIHVGELIWKDYWGPRMEDALRMALLTLLMANQKLHERDEKQFTLLDIPALYELPRFRENLLKEFVTDREVWRWWLRYFEALYDSLRLDVVNPVMTKIHRFSTHRTVRNIVGQSNSTVDWREVLEGRRILLVNTATGIIGPDAGGLLGAVLLDHINLTVREQSAIPDAARRVRAMVVIDEFQSIPGVDYAGLLAELQKMGANFVLATQTLRQLDALDPILGPTILANVDSLFVFQVSAEDAFVLARELDEAITPVDIINQPNFSCYLKTLHGRERLPVMHVETAPPLKGSEDVAEKVLHGMRRYARPVEVVERERREFTARWYDSELAALTGGRMQIAEDEEQAGELFPEQSAKQDAEALNAASPRKHKSRGRWMQKGTSRAQSKDAS